MSTGAPTNTPRARRRTLRRRSNGVHPTCYGRDLVEMHPEELFALIDPVHMSLVELPVERGLERRRIVRVNDRVDIELKGHRCITKLADTIHRVESTGHPDLVDMFTKRADVRDERRHIPSGVLPMHTAELSSSRSRCGSSREAPLPSLAPRRRTARTRQPPPCTWPNNEPASGSSPRGSCEPLVGSIDLPPKFKFRGS